jgi:hypothetical protein
LQRAVPFARVWLFLLPLVFLVGASGLAACVAALRSAALRRTAAAVLLIAAGPWLFVRAIDVKTAKFSRETGTLQDAEAIAIFLKSFLQPEDYVVSACPSSAPLVYYARRHALPMRHFESTGDPRSANRRLIVVVNKAHKQRLSDVLDELKLGGLFDPESAREVIDFDSATVYEVHRRR